MKQEYLIKGQEILARIEVFQQILKDLMHFNTTINRYERGNILLKALSALSEEEEESIMQGIIDTIEGKIKVLQDEFDKL